MYENIEIRKILLSDNESISFVIKSVLKEFTTTLKGTAYYDTETDAMFEAYQSEKSVYYIALLAEKVIGGCGINQLSGAENNICELQKMYLLPTARGLKIGKILLSKCLDFASIHYEKCYLETFDFMTSAKNIYAKNGFELINKPLGDTAHTSCNNWMIKTFSTKSLIDLKNKFIEDLKSIYPKEEIESFFYRLTEEYIGFKRIDIALNPMKKVAIRQFESALKQLKEQVPIQYIIGSTEFYSLKFKVNESTLIPRPETEELVSWIIEDISLSEKKQILDIGTGSGCIAISLAKNISKANVYGLDISKNALLIAQENANINNVKVQFLEQDILTSKSVKFTEKFDVIVSNPPYVRILEKEQMSANVLDYEPHLALFVTNEKSLIFYDKIADFAKTNLNPKGKLYFEINQYLGKETVDLLKSKGFENVVLKKDIFENHRMIRCELLRK